MINIQIENPIPFIQINNPGKKKKKINRVRDWEKLYFIIKLLYIFIFYNIIIKLIIIINITIIIIVNPNKKPNLFRKLEKLEKFEKIKSKKSWFLKEQI